MSTNSFPSLSYIFTSSNNKGWGYVERLGKIALSITNLTLGAVDRVLTTLGIERVVPTVDKKVVDNTGVIPESPQYFPQERTGVNIVMHNLSTSYPHVREIIGINLEAL